MTLTAEQVRVYFLSSREFYAPGRVSENLHPYMARFRLPDVRNGYARIAFKCFYHTNFAFKDYILRPSYCFSTEEACRTFIEQISDEEYMEITSRNPVIAKGRKDRIPKLGFPAWCGEAPTSPNEYQTNGKEERLRVPQPSGGVPTSPTESANYEEELVAGAVGLERLDNLTRNLATENIELKTTNMLLSFRLATKAAAEKLSCGFLLEGDYEQEVLATMAGYLNEFNMNRGQKFLDIKDCNRQDAINADLDNADVESRKTTCFICPEDPGNGRVSFEVKQKSLHMHAFHVIGAFGFLCPIESCTEEIRIGGVRKTIRTRRTRRMEMLDHFQRKHPDAEIPSILKPTMVNHLMEIIGKQSSSNKKGKVTVREQFVRTISDAARDLPPSKRGKGNTTNTLYTFGRVPGPRPPVEVVVTSDSDEPRSTRSNSGKRSRTCEVEEGDLVDEAGYKPSNRSSTRFKKVKK